MSIRIQFVQFSVYSLKRGGVQWPRSLAAGLQGLALQAVLCVAVLAGQVDLRHLVQQRLGVLEGALADQRPQDRDHRQQQQPPEQVAVQRLGEARRVRSCD